VVFGGCGILIVGVFVAHDTKSLSMISYILIFMVEMNQVRKSGGSMIVAIPPSMGLGIGDWIRFQREDDGIVTMIREFGGDEE